MKKDFYPTTIVRTASFMSGVLSAQQTDPLCRRCTSFAGAVQTVRELLTACDPSASLNATLKQRLETAREVFNRIDVPEEPVPQRKKGACALPGGKCLVKHSLKMFKKSFPGAADEGCGCGCSTETKAAGELPVLHTNSLPNHP